MPNQSIITILNKMIEDYGIPKKINTLIYSNNKKTDFKEVIKVITNKTGIKKVSKEDILTNNYFQKKLSLFQNIRFYSTLANISLESFVSEYSLKEQFGVLKNNNFEEIGPDIWFKYEILLYLFTNKDLLIEKNNFFNVLNGLDPDSESFIENKEIFFLSTNIKQLQQIRQLFDVFVHISDNNYEIYKNFEIFSDAITN